MQALLGFENKQHGAYEANICGLCFVTLSARVLTECYRMVRSSSNATRQLQLCLTHSCKRLHADPGGQTEKCSSNCERLSCGCSPWRTICRLPAGWVQYANMLRCCLRTDRILFISARPAHSCKCRCGWVCVSVDCCVSSQTGQDHALARFTTM